MEHVNNAKQEHIHLEEHQQHVQIVEQENTVPLGYHHVQHVLQELMDHQKQIVNVQPVHLANIHQQEQKNVFHVIQFVEVIVLHQQENVINVLQDMDLQVVLVQHVDQENIQQEEQVFV